MPKAYINGTSLYYHMKGSGTPLILIHPPLMSSANFMLQFEELSRNFCVIALDLRGHGRSDASKQPITYSLLSEDIAELMNYLQLDKAFVGGYSTGGTIALDFMLTYPKRVLGGIMISAMSEASDWLTKAEIRLAIELTKRGWIDPVSLSIAFGNSRDLEQFYAFRHDASLANIENVEQYFRCSLDYACTSELWKIIVPVLIAYGGNDRVFERYARIMHKRIRYSELHCIPNKRHKLPTRAAKQLNETINNFIIKYRTSEVEERAGSTRLHNLTEIERDNLHSAHRR